MIPPELEIRARQMVLDASGLGGELWQHVTPATVEMMVEAVALDLLEREDSARTSADPAASIPPVDPLR